MIKEFVIKYLFSFCLMAFNYFAINYFIKKYKVKEYFNKKIKLKKIVCLISVSTLIFIIFSASYFYLEISSALIGIVLSCIETTFPYVFHSWNKEIQNK